MINKRKIKCNDNDNDDNNETKVATRQNNASLTFYMFNICLLFDTSLFSDNHFSRLYATEYIGLTSFTLLKVSLVQ